MTLSDEKKIMLIDDHDISLFVTQHILKQLGFSSNSILLPSGFSALNYIKENIDNISNLPDYIFLDINMPIVDGWNFLKQFEKIKPTLSKKISIYILSGQESSHEYNEFKKNGTVEHFFTKPLKITDLQFLKAQN